MPIEALLEYIGKVMNVAPEHAPYFVVIAGLLWALRVYDERYKELNGKFEELLRGVVHDQTELIMENTSTHKDMREVLAKFTGILEVLISVRGQK